MGDIPRGVELIVTGDFNIDLESTERWGQDEGIVVVISMAGLVDLVVHILQQQQELCKDWRMWVMVRQGRVVRSQMEYILIYNHWIFQNVAV